MWKIIPILIVFCQITKPFDDVEFIKEYFSSKYVSRITFFVCSEDKIRLSKEFTQSGFQIGVSNWDGGLFNIVTKEMNHEGFVMDPTCSNAETLLNKLGKRYFTDLQYWLFIQDNNVNVEDEKRNDTENCKETLSTLGEDVLNKAEIYPNSQVVWAQRAICTDDIYALFDVYRISATTPVNSSLIGTYPDHFQLNEVLSNLGSVAGRRRNLHGIILRAGYVIQFKEHFTFMEDIHKRAFESFLKRSYPMMVLLTEDLNFRPNITITNSFGWDNNQSGVFDGGLMSQLQNDEIDICMQEVLMRHDRYSVCDFTAELVQVTARVIYRQPPLSSLSNIYILPFDFNVWLSVGGMCVLATIISGILQWYGRELDEELQDVTFLDIFTFITGVICQQGYSSSSRLISFRVTMLFVFISSLFLFTSYSANIVALLQSPSTSIKTLEDLIESPLGVGIQNITYNVVFITESKQAITKRLYEKKVLPKGERGFLSVVEGMANVRQGMYAFQVDTGAAYDEISATYTEDEKCGLAEMELYQLPMQAVPVAKNLPYRDLITIRLRWQREVGIVDRMAKIWVAQKPKCESQHGGYVSVGLTELMPAVKMFVYGCTLGFLIFIFEFLVYFIGTRLEKHNMLKKQKPKWHTT